MSNSEINLSGVRETLFLPLWGRSIESKKKNPLLVDNAAVSIVENINYDFSEIAKKINPLIRSAWIARSLFFDNEIKDFLGKYPDGSIINIGCGLDTIFDRVDNGKAEWYELDFADVINLRRKYIKETSRRIFISCSVFDEKWYKKIRNRKNVFMLFAGVIYYFEEQEIKNMFNITLVQDRILMI
ncbi:class I SAM-dependent methyltransferase [bacterium]|nr:class I SAM-dependent methyltransferase [bacterium]